MKLTPSSSVASRLVLFAASMVFHYHPSESVESKQFATTRDAEECYNCVTFEGISNPTCEYPVARKADITTCYKRPGEKIGAKCGKLVVYSKGHKEGQTLKSWLMKRECVIEANIKSRYDNLSLPCNGCGRVTNNVRIFQRLDMSKQGRHQQNKFPDEQEQVEVFMCVCCERLCNAEEGFNLTYFNALRNDASNNQNCLMILVSFVSYTYVLMHF